MIWLLQRGLITTVLALQVAEARGIKIMSFCQI